MNTRELLFLVLLLMACGDDGVWADSGATPGDADVLDVYRDLPDVVDRPDVGVDGSADAGSRPLRWEEVSLPENGPLTVWGGAVAELGEDRVIHFGGTTAGRAGGTVLGQTWLYEWRDGLVAEEIGGDGPVPRYCGCLAYDSERDVVVMSGGRDLQTFHIRPETWELDLATRSWLQIETPTSPPGVIGCMMTFVDETMYVFGGANPFSGSEPRGSNGETWRYDADVPAWVALDIAGPSPRYDGRFTTEQDGSVLLFGGAQSALSGMHGDVWRFDGIVWTEIAGDGAGPVGRRVPWLAQTNDGFIIAGGFDSDMNPIGDLWRYSVGGWEELSLGAPEPIAFVSRLPGGTDSFGTMLSGFDGDAPVRALRRLMR